jgi:hypothetical protein
MSENFKKDKHSFFLMLIYKKILNEISSFWVFIKLIICKPISNNLYT